MKGMRMGVVALALAGLVMGSGVAAASDLDKVIDDVQVELKSADMTLEVTKDGTVVTSQKVDGVEIRLEWVVPDTWVAPDQSAAAKGWLGTLIDIAISIGKDALSGGSSGGGGGGNTNTTNQHVQRQRHRGQRRGDRQPELRWYPGLRQRQRQRRHAAVSCGRDVVEPASRRPVVEK
ncbi:MAG: hypothetical protein IPL61_29490 [Myxococcales bacterium]|nr:hypothetical protein [Myxococcales bacterium]